MRVQPTVIFSISLAHTVSSAVIEKRCKDPSWDLTIENYRKAKVDDWLAWWFPEHKDSAESIPDLIAKEFFNDVGRHCPTSPGDTSGACTSVISCNSVEHTQENLTQAYFAYNSMVNLNTGMNFYVSSLQNVSVLDILQSYDLVSKFTQSAKTPDDNNLLKRLLSLGQSILAIAGGFVGAGAGALIGGAGPGGIAQLNLAIQDHPSQAQLTLDSLKAYNNFLATVYQSVQISIGDAKSALFRGDSDASNRDIIQWIKEGAFVTLADDTEAKISDYFYKTMTAGAINALWRANMVYIVGAPSDDCQHANNPSHDGYNSKVCIDGDNSAYYLYMLGNHGRPFPQVLAPSGWDSLGQLGLSIQDAVASSVAAWRATGFNYHNVARDRWNAAQSWGVGNTPWDKKASFEGVWTIPVCYDPKGTAVTNIKTDKGRNYPCRCGTLDLGEDTAAFGAASGLMSSDRWTSWCKDELYP